MSNLGTINIGDVLYNYSSDNYIIVKAELNDNKFVVCNFGHNEDYPPYAIDNDGYAFYNNRGRKEPIKTNNQVIFWDKPTIIAPPKPKVKKEYKVWAAQRWGIFSKNSKHLQINAETEAWLIFAKRSAAEKYIANSKYNFYIDEVNITYMTEG